MSTISTLPWPRPRIAVVVVALLLGLACLVAAAPEAEASRLVYVCGQDLCAVNPESGAKAKITTDGGTAAYRYPSISRDGARIAAARGSDVMVGDYGRNLTARWTKERDINDVALAPDGAAVGESHSYVANVNRFRCYPFGGCGLELVLEDFSATSYTRGGAPADSARSYSGGGGVGFLGDGALLSSYYTLDTDSHTICVVANPAAADQPCVARVATPGALTSPTGSRDGTLIAAAVADPAPATTSSVQLFDARTGARIRKLADRASSPAFSPDGKQVAYAGDDGWLHVVSTAGGKARRLVKGASPAWGGGRAPGARVSVASRKLRYRKGRIAVRIRCRGEGRCAGTLTLKKGKRKLGRHRFRVQAGKRATVRVKPTRSGRRAIKRGREQRVTVRLKPGKGKAVTKRLALRR